MCRFSAAREKSCLTLSLVASAVRYSAWFDRKSMRIRTLSDAQVLKQQRQKYPEEGTDTGHLQQYAIDNAARGNGDVPCRNQDGCPDEEITQNSTAS